MNTLTRDADDKQTATPRQFVSTAFDSAREGAPNHLARAWSSSDLGDLIIVRNGGQTTLSIAVDHGSGQRGLKQLIDPGALLSH